MIRIKSPVVKAAGSEGMIGDIRRIDGAF